MREYTNEERVGLIMKDIDRQAEAKLRTLFGETINFGKLVSLEYLQNGDFVA